MLENEDRHNASSEVKLSAIFHGTDLPTILTFRTTMQKQFDWKAPWLDPQFFDCLVIFCFVLLVLRGTL